MSQYLVLQAMSVSELPSYYILCDKEKNNVKSFFLEYRIHCLYVTEPGMKMILSAVFLCVCILVVSCARRVVSSCNLYH